MLLRHVSEVRTPNLLCQATLVLKQDRYWKFRLRSGLGGIGIGNFNLGRDRAGFDRDPECLNIFRGKKLLCEVLKINFENHKYSKKSISGRS